MQKTKIDPHRNHELAAIHAAKKQLGLDDDTYRDLLQEWVGERSAAGLDQRQRQRVIEALRRMGFERKSGPARVEIAEGDDPLAKKIKALWLTLWRQGAVTDPSERSLDKWVERQTGTSALRFTTPGQRVQLVEALKQWQARANRRSPKAR